MKRLPIILVTLLIFAYPSAIYFGLNYFSLRYIALGLICIFLLRLILVMPNMSSLLNIVRSKCNEYIVIFTTLIGIIVGLLGFTFNQVVAIKLYPVAINLLMFIIFFYSLIYPPTIIERLASIKCHVLSNAAVKYTRIVTIVWCIFFVINGLAALWTTLFSTFKLWTLYNGFLSYILIGAIFVAEFTYRQWAKRKNYL